MRFENARTVTSYNIVKLLNREERRQKIEDEDLLKSEMSRMTEFDSLILTGPELGHSVDSYCDELGETILASVAFKRLRTSNREVKQKNSDC